MWFSHQKEPAALYILPTTTTGPGHLASRPDHLHAKEAKRRGGEENPPAVTLLKPPPCLGGDPVISPLAPRATHREGRAVAVADGWKRGRGPGFSRAGAASY